MLKVFVSKMNETKITNRFTTYVGLDDPEPQSLSASGGDESYLDVAMLNPHLLSGEMVIAEAKNVLMFAPVSEQRQGKSGILTVTNFKLSFVTSVEKPKEDMSYQQNHFLAENEICLSNVDVVYQMVGDKKRRLLPGNNVSGKVKGLHILCKNMKALTFSFKFSPVDHGKTLTNALLHHAYPRRQQLLFAYDFREPYYRCEGNVRLFREHADWSSELSRTKCVGWRLSAANQSFQLSISLPQWLIVPAEVLDWQLSDAARHFRGSRPPVWCWGSPQGAALVRMADIEPSITDRVQENAMIESVRKSHPQHSQLSILDLTKDLPSIRDVQISFLKLRELCAPESLRQFWVQDNHFSSLLESSRWLHNVSQCLGKAQEASLAIQRGATVVIQEGDGRDMCCVVSSLTQLLLDGHWRSFDGFQTLVQKEWVVLGHPFNTRLAHIMSSGSESEQSPLFLVFLDCVWQIIKQFPTMFEFTETYLTSLWDSAQISIFETFLFDCERERTFAAQDPGNPLTMRSVWDWGEQFPEKDSSLFKNPLYHSLEDPLKIQCSLPMLDVWSQCYFRWMPLLEIRGGGSPVVDLQSRLLVRKVNSLRKGSVGSNPEESSFQNDLAPMVSSFYPFSHETNQTTNSTLLASTLSLDNYFASNEPMLDSQSILNAPD